MEGLLRKKRKRVITDRSFGFRTGRSCVTNIFSVYSRVIDETLQWDGWVDCIYSNNKTSIDSQQFGNMKYSSTTHCLVNFLDFVHSHLDKRNTSLALAFVGLRKAFDLVDVVATKTINLELHPNLIALLANFLNKPQWAVHYQGCITPTTPYLSDTTRHQDKSTMFPYVNQRYLHQNCQTAPRASPSTPDPWTFRPYKPPLTACRHGRR